MKVYLTIFFLFSLMIATAQDPATTYSTKPNTSDYPFPTAFPVVEDGKADQFDWNRYINEAISEGDKVFRLNQAFHYRITTIDYPIGAMESTADEWARNRIAADEVSKVCELIEEMYRSSLKNDAEALGTLEEFITTQRKAIIAYINRMGEGYEGGGARVAYSAARLDAFVRYRAALMELPPRLNLQDLPRIEFPTRSKPTE